MAARLAAAFGGSPQVWIKLQAAYDHAQVGQGETGIRPTVQRMRVPHDVARGAARAL